MQTLTYMKEILKLKDMKKLYYLLNYYAYENKTRYKQFHITKKNGNLRKIYAPNTDFCRLLKALNKVLQLNMKYKNLLNYHAHGFIKSRSIVSNANEHINAKFILNLDLKDFFTSIKYDKVFASVL